MNTKPLPPFKPDPDPDQSVAGEEDPGASLDVPGSANPHSTAPEAPETGGSKPPATEPPTQPHAPSAKRSA